jgi:hypothetical protein
MSEAKKTKKPPVARVKTGTVTAAIWARDTDKGAFYDVTFQRPTAPPTRPGKTRPALT